MNFASDIALAPFRTSSLFRLDGVTGSEISSILQELKPITMSKELTPEVRDAMQFAGVSAGLEVGAVGAFNLVNPRVVSYLNKFTNLKIKSITDTTKRKLARTLAEGVERGEGARQLAGRVRNTMSLPGVKGRAITIARTEVHNAAVFGRLEGYRQSGVVDKKKWKATIDGRTRKTHIKLNGQKPIKLEAYFRIGPSKAKAPGQFGVAKHDINCRCTILPVVARADGVDVIVMHLDQEKSIAAFWKLVRREIPGMTRAVLRGFDKWERQVIRGINKAA